MPITPTLIKLLDRAENPRAIRAACWALEKATGLKSMDLLSTGVGGTLGLGYGAGGWYERNGFHLPGWNAYGSYAGQFISRDTALQSSAFFCGVKIISEDLGALPFFVYRRSQDRTQIDKFYEHPLYTTLHDLVNPEISAGEFVESLTAHALMTGNGFAEIQRGQQTVYLWPWQPEQTRIVRDSAGKLFYINSATGKDKTYARTDVFHLKGWTLDGLQGENTLMRMRHVLGITLAVDEYRGRYFVNDATPGVVLTRPPGSEKWGPEVLKAFKEAWKQWHRGTGNSHEPAVIQDGMTIEKITPSNVESQLRELSQHQIEEVCRILRLPPHKLAELKRSTNNNIEHQGIDYVSNTIGPWADRWRRSVWRCLLTTDEQTANRVWAEMELASLTRGDLSTQSEAWRKLLEKGVFSINEVRKFLNLNPVEGGQNHFIQLNMATVQDVASGATLAQNESGTLPIR